MSNNNENPGKIEWSASSLKFFARYDGPYINETVELGNHAIRKILERQFEYMSRNLYFISAFGRFLLGYDKEADIAKAEDIATRTISNAMASLRRRIEQAETLLNNAGIKDAAMYGKKGAVKLPVTTPGAKMYAQLLTMADNFYSLNSLLWFNGEIDNKTKFANESEARKEIQGVVRGVASQFLFILNKTRQKDEKEALRAGTHNEEKLAIDAEQVINEMGTQSMTGNVAPATPEASSPESPSAAASNEVTGKPRRAKKAATPAEEDSAA